MSTDNDKIKHSTRLAKDQNAIKKQMKIAKKAYVSDRVLREPNRLSKRHAMDCGRSECYLCGNPRFVGHKDKLTAQEHRLFQDLEENRNRHSNGSSKEVDN